MSHPSVTPISGNSFNVSINIGLEFYYNEYDWGIIYRQVGAGSKEKFYKVRLHLVNEIDMKMMVSDQVQSARLRC